MILSLQSCIDKLKKVHPDLYPNWYIEYSGIYLFCLLKRGVPKNESTINLYSVDPKNETIAGPIPPMAVYGNPILAKKVRNPHIISGEDQKSLEHGLKKSDFLMHYGITGMQWGVRRFQNLDGTLTLEGKERYSKDKSDKKDSKEDSDKKESKSSTEKVGFFEKQRIETAKYADMILKQMNTPLDQHLNREDTKKDKVDKGRIVTDVAFTVINPLNAINLAADGVGSIVAKKRLETYFKNREVKSDLDPKTGLYVKKEDSYTDKQDLAAVNPGYMNMNTNTKNNCMLCTTTYDMRKRGYDVTAQLDSEGYNFADLKRWYPKAKIENNTRFDENGKALKQKEYIQKTVNNLLKQGDGARGNLMVWFNLGGGHSVAYEVQNGKLIFKDGQANVVMGAKGTFGASSPESFLAETLVNSYARLDNVQPDMKKIKAECVR